MARTRRTTIDPPSAPPAAIEPTDVELYEPELEHATAASQPSLGRAATRRRLTASLPGAIAGTFLVCALAFGASLQASSSVGAGAHTDGAVANAGAAGADRAALGDAGQGDLGADAGGDHSGGDTADQGSTGAGEPTGEATDGEPAGADATPVPEPTLKPEPKLVGLDLSHGDGGSVKLDWNACPVDGVTAWKVIRSTDEHATYPRGEGDTLIGVTDPGRTAFTDALAPAGKTLWYAVFAVAGDGDARYVACASAVRRIETPRAEPSEPAPTEPTPTSEPTNPPTSEPPAMGLTLAVKEGAIYVDWTGCEVDGAEAYKIVRSSDETVRWPLGEGDTLAAVVEVGAKTATLDEHAPAGKKAWYRVFCVRHTGDGYKVLNMTPVRGITAPSAPAPEVQAMSIEVGVDEGHAVLHWEACTGESFSHYRILRRTGETTTVVKEIENAATTSWMDPTSEAGVTYQYLVQCKGHSGDGYVLMGTTDWATVTVE